MELPYGTIINVREYLSDTDLAEYNRLKDKARRLEKLSWALQRGEKDPETGKGLTQQDVADILGVSQQLVAKSERSALQKVHGSFMELKLDRAFRE